MVQLIRRDEKSKSNWRRMIDANDKLDYADGKLIATKGWKIFDRDVDNIVTQLKALDIPFEIKDLYTIIIL